VTRRRSKGLIRSQRAEVGRLWVRYSPRAWPSGEDPWIDVGAGTLGRSSAVTDTFWDELAAVAVDDVLYLPPIAPAKAAVRDRVASAHRRRGTPVVVQVRPGDPAPAEADLVLLDPLLSLLGNPATPVRSDVVIWPLVAGLDAEEAVLRLAAQSGAGIVHGLVLELDPADRRRLAERLDEDRALDLFHGPPPDAGLAIRRIVDRGLEPLVSRPLPRPPLTGASNLRVAGLLAEAAELCARLGAAPIRSQAFLRGASWAEESGHDLAGLARDGNLDVLPWLEDEPRRLVEEAMEGKVPGVLATLRRGDGG